MTTDEPNPNAPEDYPTDADLPPPVYPASGYPPSTPVYPLPAPDYSPPYPAYPAAAYGYAPYQPVKPPGTNGKAIGALVCSAVGLTCCGLTSIVGVILGMIAMRETKRTGQDGWGIALAGTIIGALTVAGLLVYMLLYIGLIASGWQPT
jgi:Domain of unknown function (DUF4190)